MTDLYPLVCAKVAEYADLPENRNADGTVNWSFVDADVFVELSKDASFSKEYYGYYLPAFERAADEYLGKEGSLAKVTGWVDLKGNV